MSGCWKLVDGNNLKICAPARIFRNRGPKGRLSVAVRRARGRANTCRGQRGGVRDGETLRRDPDRSSWRRVAAFSDGANSGAAGRAERKNEGEIADSERLWRCHGIRARLLAGMIDIKRLVGNRLR